MSKEVEKLHQALFVIVIQDGIPSLYGSYHHLPTLQKAMACALDTKELLELQPGETYTKEGCWSATIVDHNHLTDRFKYPGL
jgi:hypothetical protein